MGAGPERELSTAPRARAHERTFSFFGRSRAVDVNCATHSTPSPWAGYDAFHPVGPRLIPPRRLGCPRPKRDHFHPVPGYRYERSKSLLRPPTFQPSGPTVRVRDVGASIAQRLAAGSVETNTLRAPLWDTAGGSPAQDSGQQVMADRAPVVARSLLGSDRTVTMSHRLSLRDLAVLAHLTACLHDAGVEAHTSLHAIGQAIYGRWPSGQDRRDIRQSLRRLYDVSITMPGYDAIRGRIIGKMGGTEARLVQAIVMEHEALELVEPSDLGKLRGQQQVSIQLATWYCEQVRAGHVTLLDLSLFRGLGSGLAARLWSYLEAESYEPQTPELEKTVVGLGPPVVATLDLGGYAQARDARAKLRAASRRILGEQGDPRYERITLRRGPRGYELLVVRLRGGQQLARLRDRAAQDRERRRADAHRARSAAWAQRQRDKAERPAAQAAIAGAPFMASAKRDDDLTAV